MRALLLLATTLAATLPLAGCPSNDDGYGSFCEQDADCGGGDVCARDGECLAASQIRGVKVTWTIRGAAASTTTCAATPDFYIDFYGDYVQDAFGYAPVPCVQGQFFIDKLPARFDTVEIGVENGFDQVTSVDASNTASFDLIP